MDIIRASWASVWVIRTFLSFIWKSSTQTSEFNDFYEQSLRFVKKDQDKLTLLRDHTRENLVVAKI